MLDRVPIRPKARSSQTMSRITTTMFKMLFTFESIGTKLLSAQSNTPTTTMTRMTERIDIERLRASAVPMSHQPRYAGISAARQAAKEGEGQDCLERGKLACRGGAECGCRWANATPPRLCG